MEEIEEFLSLIREYVEEEKAKWCRLTYSAIHLMSLQEGIVKALKRIKDTEWGKSRYEIEFRIKDLSEDYCGYIEKMDSTGLPPEDKERICKFIDERFKSVLCVGAYYLIEYVREYAIEEVVSSLKYNLADFDPTNDERSVYSGPVRYDGKEYTVQVTAENVRDYHGLDRAIAVEVLSQVDERYPMYVFC